MRMLKLAVCAAGAAAASVAWAKASRWQVDFSCDRVDRVLIPRALGKHEARWYCTFSLTNRTGADRDLAPSLFLEPMDAGSRWAGGVDPEVQQAVESRTARRLLDAVQVQGRLRADERKEGIAVFGPLPPETDRVGLFVTGLSSATEARRTGAEYAQMYRGGREVWLVERGASGASSMRPLARRIDRGTYQRLSKAGETRLWRTVRLGEGEVCYVLDDPRLTETAPKAYLERTVLRRWYARSGDEIQPQLDNYRFEGEDEFLAVEPLPDAKP